MSFLKSIDKILQPSLACCETQAFSVSRSELLNPTNYEPVLADHRLRTGAVTGTSRHLRGGDKRLKNGS